MLCTVKHLHICVHALKAAQTGVLALGQHPSFLIIIAHNREESWTRPTAKPAEHSAGIVLAKDIQAGGAYMGANFSGGSFVALTNVPSGLRAARAAGL